jgi:hypothetical protein
MTAMIVAPSVSSFCRKACPPSFCALTRTTCGTMTPVRMPAEMTW